MFRVWLVLVLARGDETALLQWARRVAELGMVDSGITLIDYIDYTIQYNSLKAHMFGRTEQDWVAVAPAVSIFGGRST